jgi:hypothetical protein
MVYIGFSRRNVKLINEFQTNQRFDQLFPIDGGLTAIIVIHKLRFIIDLLSLYIIIKTI